LEKEFNGKKIRIKGQLTVKVKVRDKVCDLPPFVAENCPDIGMVIGRNWLDVLHSGNISYKRVDEIFFWSDFYFLKLK
jgi:hypothetical protein